MPFPSRHWPALALLVLAAPAPAEPLQPRALGAMTTYFYRETFDAPGPWNFGNDQASAEVAEGRYRVTLPPAANDYWNAAPMSVPAASAWIASVDMTVTAAGEGRRRGQAGLVLIAPLGERLFATLNPEGDVSVQFWDGRAWAPPPLPPVRAAGARTGIGARNTLSLARLDGYFELRVNGEAAGRTRVLDFSPRFAGVAASADRGISVDFDNLGIAAGARDSRFLRLMGLSGPTPGALTFFTDTFDRDAGAPETRWALHNEGGFTSRVEGGRLLLSGPGNDSNMRIGNTAGLVGRAQLEPGFQVSVSLHALQGNSSFGRGIDVTEERPAGARQSPALSLQVTDTHLRLLRYHGDGRETVLLPWTPTPSLRAGSATELNLTVTGDGRAMMFVNGDYQTAVPLPTDFKPYGLSVRVTGPQTVAFDDFQAREL